MIASNAATRGTPRRAAVAAAAIVIAACALVAGGPARASLPAVFEENRGQAPAELHLLMRRPGWAVGFERAAVRIDLGGESLWLDLGASAEAAPPVGVEPLESHSSYLIGADPSQWQRAVPHYARVRYANLRPGIDVEFYEKAGELEYDVFVRPGADPGGVRLAFRGAEQVRVDEAGALRVRRGGRELVQRAPVVYQDTPAGRRIVSARYRLFPGGGVGIALGAFDPAHTVVVDPVLVYASPVGGTGQDFGHDVDVDALGNAYVVGSTASTDFSTQSPLQGTSGGGIDAFVAKIKPSGLGAGPAALVWATYFGGGGDDAARSVRIDDSGAVFFAGHTTSTDLPTANPAQAQNAGGQDGFIAKLTPAGDALVFATYLGGTGEDTLGGIDVGPSGSPVVHGVTDSADLPVVNAVQATYGGDLDGFAAKLAPDGSVFGYVTYLGGSGADDPLDTGVDVRVDADANAVFCGTTESTDFPTANAFQDEHGGGDRDGWLAKLDPAGAFVFSTFVGREGGDTFRALDIDADGNLYVAGGSRSHDFPLVNPAQARKSVLYDVVVVKFDPLATRMLYSTFVGGDGADAARSIRVDDIGNVYVAGHTESTSFPVVEPFQSTNGGFLDNVVFKLSPSGSTLIYSTYYGGMAYESPYDRNLGIALDPERNAYLVGSTSSIDLPLVDPMKQVVGFDAFLAVVSATPEVRLSLADPGGGPQLTLAVWNPTALPLEIELKVFADGAAHPVPVTIPLPVGPTTSVPAGQELGVVAGAPLPGSIPFPGSRITARVLNPISGRVLAESVCEDVPCH